MDVPRLIAFVLVLLALAAFGFYVVALERRSPSKGRGGNATGVDHATSAQDFLD
ncbi:hypothetical protein [Nocardioides solisilvae]|uniref:hypothetical protein n=1 Tax=Nocardioides solisilvae TaxID=1542435 RepID=UPI0013A5886D|nr:hypothetical protein [Nocardioides solisilvae]